MRLPRWGLALGAMALAAGAGCADKADEPASNRGPGVGGPVAFTDHWHAAFGVFVCDRFLPDPAVTENAIGIHTHGDGVIHIHSFKPEGAGANATLGLFLRDTTIDLEDGGLEVDGVTWHDGQDCDGKPARVVVARWDDAARGGEPEIVTDDLTGVRFRADGEAFTVAFVPEGADIPLPPSAANLVELGQADSGGPATTGIPGTPESEPVAEDGFYPVSAVAPATGAICPPGTAGAEDPGGSGECLTLGQGPIGMDVVDDAEADEQAGQWLVRLRLTDEGIHRFNELAADCFQAVEVCLTRRVAIVVDGRVRSAPTVNNPSYEADQIQISGSFTEQEVRALAEAVAG